MAYPQKLLAPGETIHYEMHPHWRGLIVPAITLVLTVFIGSWLFFLTDVSVLRWVIGVAMVVLVVWRVLVVFLQWITTEYVFTDRRIIVRRGLITRQGRDMPLSKVVNVSFTVPALGRVLNYGRLDIQSAGDDSDLDIVDVPNVESIQRDVYELNEQDDARRRRQSQQQDTDPVGPGDGT